MTGGIEKQDAQAALDQVARAEQRVSDEVGLPRAYWWGMALGWVALGASGDLAPIWLAAILTGLFGVGQSIVASRLLNGRRRSRGLQVSAAVAGRRIPAVVVAMLVALVLVTIGVAIALAADGAAHAAIWAGVLMAAVIGFGGEDLLRASRRLARA